MPPRICSIVDIIENTTLHKTFYFSDEKCRNAKPGQFIMIWIPGVDEIPMSLSFIGEKQGVTVEKKGEGTKMLREGETEIGGRIPVNVDGGLKAKGHPIGATGVSMIAELTKQLREEVKPTSRQAPMKNYIAMAHNVGGTGHYCYVTILKR